MGEAIIFGNKSSGHYVSNHGSPGSWCETGRRTNILSDKLKNLILSFFGLPWDWLSLCILPSHLS